MRTVLATLAVLLAAPVAAETAAPVAAVAAAVAPLPPVAVREVSLFRPAHATRVRVGLASRADVASDAHVRCDLLDAAGGVIGAAALDFHLKPRRIVRRDRWVPVAGVASADCRVHGPARS